MREQGRLSFLEWPAEEITADVRMTWRVYFREGHSPQEQLKTPPNKHNLEQAIQNPLNFPCTQQRL